MATLISDKPRILAVDDDPDIRLLLESALADRYEVVALADGADGWAQFARVQPDLVILDVMMPGMDGWQVLSRIRRDSDFREIPVVMLTALNARDDMKKGYEVGANVYLTKPFEIERLRKNVSVSLQGRPMRQKKYALSELAAVMKAAPGQEPPPLHRKMPIPVVPHPPLQATPTPASPASPTDASTRRFASPPPATHSAPHQPGHPAAHTTPPGAADTSHRRTPILPVAPPPSPSPGQAPPSTAGDSSSRRFASPPPDSSKAPMAIPRAAPPPVISQSARQASTSATDRPRAFIVVEELQVAEVVKTLVDTMCESYVCRDGLDAKPMLSDIEPDFLVVAGKLPRVSGYQLIDAIRGDKVWADLPIIFITDKDRDKDRLVMLNKGVRHVMASRPAVRPHELTQMIKEVISAADFTVHVKTYAMADLVKGVHRKPTAVTSMHAVSKDTMSQFSSFLKDNKDNPTGPAKK